MAKLGFVASSGINTGLLYERSISDHFSLSAQVGYASILDIFGENANGFGLFGEGRYYFTRNKDLMEGWHAGVYLHYLNTKTQNDYQLDRTGLGLVGGYQWIFTSHFTIDTMLGGGYMSDTSDDLSDDNGIYPFVGINFGYNF